MRNVPAGTIQDAVQRAYDAFHDRDGKTGVERIARRLGTVKSTVSYGTEISDDRPGGIGVNYLDRLGQEQPAVALPIAQHFAALAGAVVQPAAEGSNVACLYSLSGIVAKECGEAQAATIAAAQSVCARDCDKAVREIDEAVAALLRAKAEILAKRGAA